MWSLRVQGVSHHGPAFPACTRQTQSGTLGSLLRDMRKGPAANPAYPGPAHAPSCKPTCTLAAPGPPFSVSVIWSRSWRASPAAGPSDNCFLPFLQPRIRAPAHCTPLSQAQSFLWSPCPDHLSPPQEACGLPHCWPGAGAAIPGTRKDPPSEPLCLPKLRISSSSVGSEGQAARPQERNKQKNFFPLTPPPTLWLEGTPSVFHVYLAETSLLK